MTGADGGGRYEILGVIGRGGFGAVYHARYHGRHGFLQDVALKVVLPGQADGEASTRLRDEARVLALLHHPNIVAVHRLSLLDVGWAVAMERVQGVDLAQLVAHLGRMPVGPSLEVVAQVADALEHAWGLVGPGGVPLRAVHRDIKPQNLRLTRPGIVKVLDFGIAHALFSARESRTARDRVPGTLEYMAPERFEGVQGPEGDLYALGAVLYAMLAGEGLGPARDEPAAHEGRIERRLARLADSRPELPHEVLDLLYSMVRFDPTLRPDAGAVARRARLLARTLGGAALVDLAGRWILSVGAEAPESTDAVVGTTLVERAAPDEPPADATVFAPVVAPTAAIRGPRRASALVPGVTAAAIHPAPPGEGAVRAPDRWVDRLSWTHASVFAALLLVALGLALRSGVARTQAPSPEAVPPTAPPVVAAELPPSTPAQPTDETAPAPAPAPERVQVRVSGDAAWVELVRAGRRVRLPAAVAPGEWEVQVRFPSREDAASKGTVVVRPGLTIHCQSAFLDCDW